VPGPGVGGLARVMDGPLNRIVVAPTATTPPAIDVRRVYDDPKGTRDEFRVLVDRLWPRGMSKQSLRIDKWAKDAAPSTELRQWYGHEPRRFQEFSKRYLAELRRRTVADQTGEMLRASSGHSALVLLTATKDVERSGAMVLARHLRRRRAS
jgi:uncharacterized protein YeaO (DUF488 family)